jgi:hypothetical protein
MLYDYSAGIASPNEYSIPNIVTPISQSSYTLYRDTFGLETTRITASFGGVSDAGSYTSIFGNGSTSSSSSDTISFYFGESAGTCYELKPVFDFPFALIGSISPNAVGGKRRLYTAIDTILPVSISAQFAYSSKDSAFTSGASHIYSQTNFSGSSLLSSYGTIGTNSSIVTNLKYIQLNNDSWKVVDHDLAVGNNYLGGAFLDSPTTVFFQPVFNTASNRGIYANFQTYYGSTYWN